MAPMELDDWLIVEQCRQAYDNFKAAKEGFDKYGLGGFTVFLGVIAFVAAHADNFRRDTSAVALLVVPAIGAVYLMIARALLARYVIARFWLVYRQVRFRDQSRVLDADNSFFRIEYHHNEELKGIPNSITNHQRAAALSFWGLTLGVSVYFIWLFMDWAPAYWFCNYRVFVPFMTVVLGLAAATMITIVSARAFYDLERVFEREYESERAGEPTDNESDKG